jgi:hypothetical protein
MRLALTIALSTLMLSGCMADWPSHKTGPRWKEGPGTTQPPDVQSGSILVP